MTKKDIRKSELERRMRLSDRELQENSSLISHHFSNFSLPQPQYLLSYCPIKERNEFDVSICEQIVKEQHPQINLAWPRMVLNTSNMEAHVVEKDTLFMKNKFNILEPLTGKIVLPELIDVVFVPLVVFDKYGFRVGYGGGFYDRYLKTCRNDALKIGFSFFDPVQKIDDINEFDVPLNLCITPTCIYEF